MLHFMGVSLVSYSRCVDRKRFPLSNYEVHKVFDLIVWRGSSDSDGSGVAVEGTGWRANGSSGITRSVAFSLDFVLLCSLLWLA